MKRLSAIIGTVLLVAGAMSMAPVLVAAAPVAPDALVIADAKSDACAGIGLAGSDCNSGASTSKLNGIIKTGLNIFSIIIGIVAVVMIIVAGFRFITSGGDTGKVAGAKNAILYAIIGLIVVVFAQSIVFFVLRNV